MSNVTRPSPPRRIARVGVAACIVLGVAWDTVLGQPGASSLDEDMVRAVATAAEIAAQRDTDAREAQAAANAALQEAAAARARADAALARARTLEAQANATQAERDAARAEAESLRAEAAKKEAARITLEQRADAAQAQAHDAALGAFVVVAFVLLPYFPNTGDAPAAPVPPADPSAPAGISPAELETLRGQAARAEAERDAARRREQELAQALDDVPAWTAPPPVPDPRDRISPAELAALRSRIEQAETERDAAQARERELARALDAATSSVQSLPPIDLIIALDTTSSMTGEVASLREEIAVSSEPNDSRF